MNFRRDTFYNFLVAEGSPEALDKLRSQLRSSFTDLSTECGEEAARHKDWFQREVGGFGNSVPNHSIAGWDFETEPAPDPFQPSSSMAVIRGVIESAVSRGLTVGYLGIDTRQIGGAVAGATCSDVRSAVVGSLGHDRHNYFRIMQHLFYDDDPGCMIRELASGTAIGPVPYHHRSQWSESDSPLRLQFRTDDPCRGNWGLSFGEPRAGNPVIIDAGFLPPLGTSVSAHVSWAKAHALIQRAQECGIDPFLDEDAQLMVSAYGLFGAGVIDSSLELTQKDAAEMDAPTEKQARGDVMILYVEWLCDFVSHSKCEARTRALACGHLQAATEWLAERGIIPTSDRFPALK